MSHVSYKWVMSHMSASWLRYYPGECHSGSHGNGLIRMSHVSYAWVTSHMNESWLVVSRRMPLKFAFREAKTHSIYYLKGHFPQRSPVIDCSFAERDLRLQAFCGSPPPCINKSRLTWMSSVSYECVMPCVNKICYTLILSKDPSKMGLFRRIHIQVCTYIYIYVYVYLYIYIYIYVCMYMYMYIYIYLCVCMLKNTSIYICNNIYVHVYVYIYI